MTPAILDWLKETVLPLQDSFGFVFEIGAMNINGSARDVLGPKAAKWIACDRRPGNGVELVANAADWLRVHPASCDMVVACECYEHDPFFWLTHKAAKAALKHGALYVVTSPTIGFPFHDYGGDFYRFTEMALRDALFAGLSVLDVRTVGESEGQCVVGVARHG